MTNYNKYFRDVSHLSTVDVYRVLELFDVTDHALGHAAKKLLLAGLRTGGKGQVVDVMEARDTLNRWLEMQAEDGIVTPGTSASTRTPKDDCKMVSTKRSVWKPEVVDAVALPEIDWSGAPWDATHAKAPHAHGPIEFLKQLPGRWKGWIDGRWQYISVIDLPYLMAVRPEPDWDKGEARIDRIAASAGDGEHYDVLMLPEDFFVPEGLRFISVLDNGQAVGHVNKPILIDNGGELCWNPQGENVYLGLLDSGFGLYEFIGDHWILTEAVV